ncbi:PAS domain-containing protein [Brevundimonas bacteroides]|uniref:PAS domain-containing protein n=1 Tax=Brevundimonas bacteroides TaxID=74311 RepID=UPI00068E95ED|nr:PAS domain-containing protein [Brevundimonas bacteroides]
MSARIRAHDWASTPLGPIEAWPQSLKTIVGMMVAAPNPMVLLWGHKGTLLYNDGYARFAGRRHPELLGMGAREGWPEIADFNDQNIRRALAGEAWSLNRQELVLDRQGRLESAWLDLDYTPVPDETGAPAGLMVFVNEITELVAAERRQAEERDRQDALIALDDAISRTDDPLDMAEAAAAILGHTFGADRVGYGIIDPDQETVNVVRDWRAAPETASVVGSHHFRDYGVYVEDIVAGRAVTIDDVRTDPRTRADPLPLLSYGVAALLDAPLQEGGRTVAQMLVHSATPRVWTPEEIAFAREFGERARAAIARREAERDAARRRDELQRLTDSLTVLVSFVDRDHRYQLNNRAYADWFGPKAESLVGRPLVEVLGEAAYAKALPRIEAALAGETLTFEDFLPYAGVRGRHIRADYIPRRDDTGAVDGFYAVVSDISGRKEAELRQQALVEIGDAMRDLADPACLAARAAEVLGKFLKADRVGYATVDTVAETIHVEQDWVSDRARSIAGTLRLRDWGDFIDDMKTGAMLRVDDVRGDPRAEGAIHSLEEAACRAFINVPVLEGGDLVAMVFVNQADARVWSDHEVELVRQVAIRIRIEVERARATQALRTLNATLEERVVERTAELMHAEEALRQSQKMEAIGQLTGGIAHDFNNLLAGISGSLELIEKRMAEGRLAGMDRYIQAAQGASRRAATLTQRLLAFSRRQTLDPKPTDVNRLVLGMEDLIRRSVGPDVRVTLETDPDLWTTRIDPSQLENALLNLCINSRDAMAPDGGDLTIRTYNVTLDAAEARFRDLPPGDYVKMSVTDTGSGMTPDVMAKAFDPFFTTKPLGQGTGLGLSMIHGFMRQSGGQVRIESAPGQGTTITLALPRWLGSADAGEGPEVEAAAEEETGQGETVLVIDDEETVRMLVVEVLEDAGYSVLQAADGPAGLAILNSDARIDLLVSDVGLPGGMNGRQVADAARVGRPELKVLFITGYAENAVVAGDTLEPGMAVMTKPFQVSALGARIREMIEG